jgi:Putative transposase
MSERVGQPPISNHRLLAFDQERVTFRWKDYAHGGKQGKMTLAATEFLRRFFLHVLPRGFVRIRHFGFLANRFRATEAFVCLPHGDRFPAPLAAHPPAGTCDALQHHHPAFPGRQCSIPSRLRTQVAFKSHSAPRPPQTPAASS